MRAKSPQIKITPTEHPQALQIVDWILGYVASHPRLGSFQYDIDIVEKTGEYWDAMAKIEVGADGPIAKLSFKDPIEKSVLFHELMHIQLSKVSGATFSRLPFYYAGIELNRRTRSWIKKLHTVFEEWFVELFLFNHVQEYRDDENYIQEFLGQSYEDYLKDLDQGIEHMEDDYFGSLNYCFQVLFLQNSRAYRHLFFHALLTTDNRIPDSYRPRSASGINAALVGVLSQYANISILDYTYYLSLFSEFINTIVKYQLGTDENATYVIKNPRKRARMTFTQTFESAISAFNAEMVYLDSIEPMMKETIRKCVEEGPYISPWHLKNRVLSTLIPTDLEFTEMEADGIYESYLQELASDLGVEIDDLGLKKN